MKNRKGFTLVELLVVITIIGIITVLALPGVQQLQARNRNKKFETYTNRMNDAGKLYVDAYSNDLFGITGDGCYDISYSDLKSKSLIKNYATDDVVCDDSKSYVHVERIAGKYKYEVALYCTQNGNVIYNKTASKCGADTITALPTIKVTFKNIEGNNNWSKSKTITFKITAEEGFNANTSIRYGWSSEKGQEPTNIKEYNFRNDAGEKELTYTITESSLDGQYYFFVNGDDVVDIRGHFASDIWSDEKIKFDNTNPTTPVLTNSYNGVWANASYVNANKYVIGVASSDANSGIMYYQYRYPNSENVWHTYDSSAGNTYTTTAFKANRNEIVEIRACDYAGNCSEVARNTIMIDNIAPTCTISVSGTQGNNGWYKSSSVTLNLATNDTGGSNISGYNLTTGSSPSYSGTTNAQQGQTAGTTWYGYVRDTAGNTASCNVGVHVDSTAPATPTVNVNGTSVTMTSSDTISGIWAFEYRPQGSTGGFTRFAETGKQTITAAANQTIEIRAVDWAGNTSGTVLTKNCNTSGGTLTYDSNKGWICVKNKIQQDSTCQEQYQTTCSENYQTTCTENYTTTCPRTCTGTNSATCYNNVKCASGRNCSCGWYCATGWAGAGCYNSIPYDCSTTYTYDCSYSCQKTRSYTCTKTRDYTCTKTRNVACKVDACPSGFSWYVSGSTCYKAAD